MTEGTGMAELFAAVSESLAGSDDVPITFDRVVQGAVEVVPGCDACGLTLRSGRGRLSSAAASSDRAARADTLQFELEEGPCLEAAFEHETFVVGDLLSDPRWPRWGAAASALGFRSAYAVSLRAQDGVMGALNFFAEEPGTFTHEDGTDTAMAGIYAVHAGAAMRRARLVTGLTSAMESRHVIGMAQGVLAVVYDLTYEAAFEVLRRYSSHTNVKLREVAEQVVQRRSLTGLTAVGGPTPDPDATPDQEPAGKP